MLVFADCLSGLVAAYGYDLLRFVEIKGAIAVHLHIYQHVGIHQLRHQNGVLTDHDGTGTR